MGGEHRDWLRLLPPFYAVLPKPDQTPLIKAVSSPLSYRPTCSASPQLLSICSWTASRTRVGTGSNGPQTELWSHGGNRSSGGWTPVQPSYGTLVFLAPGLLSSLPP